MCLWLFFFCVAFITLFSYPVPSSCNYIMSCPLVRRASIRYLITWHWWAFFIGNCYVLDPFEIRAEDDQKIFKAVDCVDSVSPDKDGCVHCSLFPVINDCFADAERKVVVRLPLCQESHLLPVDGPIIVCNQECNQFELYLAEQSCKQGVQHSS